MSAATPRKRHSRYATFSRAETMSIRKLSEFSELQPIVEEHLAAMKQLEPLTERFNKFNNAK